MDELDTLRSEIDTLDKEIMDLLEKRFDISERVGTLKKQNTLNVSHLGRERSILDKATDYKHKNAIEDVYGTIFKNSKQIQK